MRTAARIAGLVAGDFSVLLLLQVVWNEMLGVGAIGASLVGDVLRDSFDGWQFAVAIVLGLAASGSYGRGDRRRDPVRLLAGTAMGGTLALWTPLWSQSVGLQLGIVWYAVMVAGVWGGLLIERMAAERLVAARWAQNKRARRAIVVGLAIECRSARGNPIFGPAGPFELAGCVPVDDVSRQHDRRMAPASHGPAWDQVERRRAERRDVLGRFEHLFELIVHRGIESVVLYGYVPERCLSTIADAARVAGCELVSFVPSYTTAGMMAGMQHGTFWHNGIPLVTHRPPTFKIWQLIVKRATDILGSVVGIVLLSPLFVCIAVWIRIESPGPVFFGQVRLGAGGRRFRCYKFRSMRLDAEDVLRSTPGLYRRYVENHYKLPPRLDPRLTRVGRFLRRTSLDELPQLMNVLKGDMSLVGPRPIVPAELEHYDRRAPLFLSIKPGMTGAWVVSGRSEIGYPDRVDLELEYVRTWSLLKDISILQRTIPIVFRRRGAH